VKNDVQLTHFPRHDCEQERAMLHVSLKKKNIKKNKTKYLQQHFSFCVCVQRAGVQMNIGGNLLEIGGLWIAWLVPNCVARPASCITIVCNHNSAARA
jgi:hypothetical protein